MYKTDQNLPNHVSGSYAYPPDDIRAEAFRRTTDIKGELCLVCLINPKFSCRTCDRKICEECVTRIRVSQKEDQRQLTMLCPHCTMGYGWKRI